MNVVSTEIDLTNKSQKNIVEKSKKTGSDSGQVFTKAFKKKLVFFGGGIAGFLLGKRLISNTLEELTRLSSSQQDAVNDLNTSLKLTGIFTKQNSVEMQNFASKLQLNSRIGDEVILTNVSLLQSLGNLTKEGLKTATQAALDLAEGLKLNLQTAFTLVGKAAAGEVSSFSRYGIIVKKTGNITKDFDNLLRKVTKQFGGSALAKLNTYTGSVGQLENTWGDVLEKVGDLITKNPLLVKVIRTLTSQFDNLNLFLDKNKTNLKLLVVDGFSLFIKASGIFIRSIFTITKSLKEADTFIKRITSSFVSDDLNKRLQESLRKSVESGDTIVRAASKAEANRLKVLLEGQKNALRITEEENNKRIETLSKLNNKIDQLVNKAIESSKLSAQKGEEVSDQLIQNNERIINKSEQAVFSITDLFSRIPSNFEKLSKIATSEMSKLQIAALKLSKEIAKSFGQGIGAGFGQFGAALANGENSLDAFAKAFLGTLGQMMIQQGTAFILQGLGFQLIPGLQGSGSALIGVGAALATFGGVLSTIGTSVGGSTISNSSFSDTGQSFIGDDSFLEDGEEERQANTHISVNVDGTVLDPRAVGRQIAEVLQEVVDIEGVRISGIA